MAEMADFWRELAGFRMPAEYEPHSQTWMMWPERPDNWRLGAKPAQAAFVQVAEAIARFEPVTMGVSAEQYENASNRLSDRIRVVELSSNDAWCRDTGPTFVINDQGEIRGIDWTFNAWGGMDSGLYFPWNKDDQVAGKICSMERITKVRANAFVLEGGAIHVDGEGTVLTTEECLLNPNRNPHLNKNQIDYTLRQALGASKVIWLPQGIYNDETNGHIDNMACFVRPGEVALAWTDDPEDPQYGRSQKALQILESSTDAKGRSLTVHRIPMPSPIVATDEETNSVDFVDTAWPRKPGTRMAASYVNFYLCNGGLIMPVFDDPADEQAKSVLQRLFPERQVVTVPGREILLGGGNIHCITQQQPQP